MNKTQLVDVVAKEAQMKKKDAEAAVEAVFAAIADAIADGDKVQIIGFGTFEARKRAARTGINPATKAEIKIPACTVPVFKFGKSFKDQF